MCVPRLFYTLFISKTMHILYTFFGQLESMTTVKYEIILGGRCGILPKNCRVAPSPLDTQTPPCDAWHSSFHPSGSEIPPGCLTSRIPSGRHPTFSGCLTVAILSDRHLTFFGCLTVVILSGRHPTFSGCLIAAILSSRRSTFSGYFTSGACRRMGEEDDSTSPGRHVRIL